MRIPPQGLGGAENNMIEDFFDTVSHNFKNGFKTAAGEYSPLNLAYIGDAVFEIFVRTMVIEKGNMSVNKLHGMSKKFVNAKAQAEMFDRIKDVVTQEELAVLKRGRNAKSFTSAKNASVVDYRHATGLEALFGYLYIKGENERLAEIFNMCIEKETLF